MGVGRVGWATEPYGARNHHRGDYDTSLYFTVWLGLPVWFSFRGCAHHIDMGAARKSEDRLDRIGEFAQDYLGRTDLDPEAIPEAIYIPLRPCGALKRMAVYFWLLGIAGIPSVLAVLGTAALLASRPLRPGEGLILAGLWAVFAAFVTGLRKYLALRKPSPRQMQIRGVVKGLQGPFSDPEGWRSDVLERVAAKRGVPDASPTGVLIAADRAAASGEFRDALLLARVAMGLAGPGDVATRERAEGITDECLRRLTAARPDRRE